MQLLGGMLLLSNTLSRPADLYLEGSWCTACKWLKQKFHLCPHASLFIRNILLLQQNIFYIVTPAMERKWNAYLKSCLWRDLNIPCACMIKCTWESRLPYSSVMGKVFSDSSASHARGKLLRPLIQKMLLDAAPRQLPASTHTHELMLRRCATQQES